MCGITMAFGPFHDIEAASNLIWYRGIRTIKFEDKLLKVITHRLPTSGMGSAFDPPIKDYFQMAWLNGNIYGIEVPDTQELLTNDRPNNMEGFGIIYNGKDTIKIVQDGLCFVPCYYTIIKDTFFLSSEMKPLVKLAKPKENKSHKKTIGRFLYPIDNSTPFEGIHKLPPMTCLMVTIKEGKIKVTFEKMEFFQNIDPKSDLKKMVVDSVKAKSNSCLDIVVPVSGGIDSSIIAYEISKLPIDKNFVYINTGNEIESENIFLLEKILGQKIVEIKASKDAKKAAWHMESYFDLGGVMSEFCLAISIKKKFPNTTVINGNCPDELFCGYSRNRAKSTIEFIEKIQRGKDNKKAFPSIIKTLSKMTLVDAMFEHDVMHELPFYSFVKQSRAFYGNTLDARNPYFDKGIFSFAKSLPLNKKINPIMNKIALRNAYKDVLPHYIVNAPKIPFKMPGWEGIDMYDLWKEQFGEMMT